MANSYSLRQSWPLLPNLQPIFQRMNSPAARKESGPRSIDVLMLPSLIDPLELAGRTVVVVDVLRATTTIICALANGCREVWPSPSIEAARELHQQLGKNSVIGGERQGKIVDGFHHGNSPIEYTPSVIKDRQLILATTNGTVAMEACRHARCVLIGAFVNVGAVASQLANVDEVTVLCSGTDRIITSEDVLFAGALVDRLLAVRGDQDQEPTTLTDQAKIAHSHWSDVHRQVDAGTPLVDFFRVARGGINLMRIGHAPDVEFAAQTDVFDHVPELDLSAWTIR